MSLGWFSYFSTVFPPITENSDAAYLPTCSCCSNPILRPLALEHKLRIEAWLTQPPSTISDRLTTTKTHNQPQEEFNVNVVNQQFQKLSGKMDQTKENSFGVANLENEMEDASSFNSSHLLN